MLRRAAPWVLALLLLWPGSAAAGGRLLVVAPEGPYQTLAEALAVAGDGDTIRVEGGLYHGSLTVERSVRLVGVGWPVLDGGGTGTVLRIRAPGVEVRGFHIRGTGDSLDQENAGIYVEATEAVIVGNRLEDVLFGIYLKQAPRSRVVGNRIEGKAIDIGLVGDGIRLWNSHDSLVRGNEVTRARQVIIQHSDRTRVEQNRLTDLLIGIHSMVSQETQILENEITRCDVGIYAMYGFRVVIRDNRIVQSRGPSGYGVGLKDMDDTVVEGNRLIGNRAGIYLDNSPRRGGGGHNWIRGNVLVGNDGGVLLQPSVSGNTFTENSFIDNLQQVRILGGGGAGAGNQWNSEGLGNFWSDYAGYDADGDGVGDLPYRPASLYEGLVDRRPDLAWFLASPAVSALEMAGRIFPPVAGPPRLSDEAPLVRPPAPLGAGEARSSSGPFAVPLGLLAGAAGLIGLAVFRRDRL